MRFLYDTAVFVYAVGTEHPYRDSCRDIVERARSGDLAGEASVELVQEFAHVRVRRTGDRTSALELAGNVAQLCRLHAFEPGDLPLMLTLLERHERLGVRDAVFAATALNRGVGAILSPDRAFDGIRGLRRVDPADARAVAALAT
jgi:predicted nucleic acid-binding protein